MPPVQILSVFGFINGYKPAQPVAGPGEVPNSIYRASNLWLRPNGRLVPVRGVSQISATSLGARIFPLDQYRGSIAGGLISGNLPKCALVRYLNSALFFCSENTSQQVYINESTTTPFTLTGVTTSTTAKKLRVALLSGTTYNAWDAGLTAPLSVGTVSTETNGSKSMDGVVSIVACARRISTNTTSNPSLANVQTMSAGGNNRLRVVLGSAQSGSDGWLFGGSDWGRGNYGPWNVIRETKVSFTVNATNGSDTVTTNADTNARFYVQPGDKVTINATDYYVQSGANAPTETQFKLASDAAGTVPVNFAGATGAYTLTYKEVVLDYRNEELGELIEFDNDLPPALNGLITFGSLLIGWSGNQIIPSKISNPEAFPAALRRTTQSGADIVNIIVGDGRFYILTTNSLEVATFTQDPDNPFIVRLLWNYGFTSPNQAVVAEGRLYAAVGTSSGVKIVRTRVDDDPDLEFGADVESDMTGWSLANTVLAVNATNGAVLAMNYDGTTNTTVIPWMLQQNQWGPPQTITGRVTDACSVSNLTELIIYDGVNYRANHYEGGNGSSTSAYVVTPLTDGGADGIRKHIKRLKFTGRANTLRVYRVRPGETVPDVTSTGAAVASFTLTNTTAAEAQIQTNIQDCQLYAVRIDSTGADASISETIVAGMVNRITR